MPVKTTKTKPSVATGKPKRKTKKEIQEALEREKEDLLIRITGLMERDLNFKAQIHRRLDLSNHNMHAEYKLTGFSPEHKLMRVLEFGKFSNDYIVELILWEPGAYGKATKARIAALISKEGEVLEAGSEGLTGVLDLINSNNTAESLLKMVTLKASLDRLGWSLDDIKGVRKD